MRNQTSKIPLTPGMVISGEVTVDGQKRELDVVVGHGVHESMTPEGCLTSMQDRLNAAAGIPLDMRLRIQTVIVTNIQEPEQDPEPYALGHGLYEDA